ncbi:hypothetical protein PVAP13_9KG358826 [Panicum virgatum]|uniref:Uncharacterized protein n=1 Tax=Panicum virgatum TaxID=38727 RepID=A0A8T0P070_PANVG|nr:hypothetical protein PVAP13_9KG358826 [Panicum virgatum]
MGRFQFQSAAAVVLFRLLLLFLATDAAGLGAQAKQLQQRQPQDLPHFCEGDVEFITDDEGPVPGDQSGLRTFSVEIVNKSDPARVLSNVHVSCAGFEGLGLVVFPPSNFKLISERECLVNDGGQLNPAQSVVFQYERHSR